MRAAPVAVLLTTLVAASTRADPSAGAAPATRRALSADSLTDAEFAFVRSIEGRRFWSSRVAAEARGAHQAIQLLDSSSAFAAVARAKLPAELKPLASARVRLHTAGGEACEVPLRHWGVLAEFNPVPEGEGDAEPDPAELARRAFSSDESAVLSYAVDITDASKACGEVFY